MIVNRDKRENVVNDFDREAISAHDIEFFDVLNVVICEIIDEANKIENEAIDENIAIDVNVANDNANEINEINNSIVVNEKVDFSVFICFVRTCSCNFVLLANFSKQRLQTKISVLFFVIRVSSIAHCFVMRVFSICIIVDSNLFIKRSQKCCIEIDFKLFDKSSCHCLISSFKK